MNLVDAQRGFSAKASGLSQSSPLFSDRVITSRHFRRCVFSVAEYNKPTEWRILVFIIGKADHCVGVYSPREINAST